MTSKCSSTHFTNVLADTVSRFRAVGLYHDLDLKDHQQEFSVLFESLPPVEPTTHIPLEINEVSLHLILKNSCRLMMHYMIYLLG